MIVKHTVLYEGESPYGSYKIIDGMYNGRPARVLYGRRGTPQSGVAKDEHPQLLFDYNQRFLEMVMSVRPKRVLVIGGGAFMLPIALYYRFPRMVIDVVEIDPLLVKLSRDFFDLPDAKRLGVYIDDGAAFVHRAKKRYDMIILDAFSGYTIPHHLLEAHAIADYKRLLKRSGVLALNFISEYKISRRRLAHELIDSFGEQFTHRSLYQADYDYIRGEEQNLLLVASNKPVHFEYLQSHELELFE